MKPRKKTIYISSWLLLAIVFNAAIPIRAQQQEQLPTLKMCK